LQHADASGQPPVSVQRKKHAVFPTAPIPLHSASGGHPALLAGEQPKIVQ
jgi:hypothetical protein